MNRKEAKNLLPIIRAYAEGEEIQARIIGSAKWLNCVEPGFLSDSEYRIKPETKKGWYRVALQPDGSTWTINLFTASQERDVEKSNYFIKWLTERIEYEYETDV